MGAERFAELYRAHRQPLLRYCLRRTKDRALAEDIVQEVFAKAFRQMARYDVSRPFWPWILSMAANRCVDVYRRGAYAQARIEDLAAQTDPDHEGDPTADAVVSRIQAQRLERALADLPARQRVALQLFALDGWSYPEIAAQLGCTVATIKQRIVRARATLRHTGTRLAAGAGAVARVLSSRARPLLERLPGVASVGRDGAGSWAQVAAAVIAVTMASSSGTLSGSKAPTTPAGGPSAASPDPAGRGHDTHVQQAPTPAPGIPRTPPRSAERPLAPYQRAVESTIGEATQLASPPPGLGSTAGQTRGFAVSPSYGEDRTVYAGGPPRGDGSGTLLVTRDGGATWHQPAARNLGYVRQIQLPPAYPDDPDIFVVTSKGLQQSTDGGETFETLVPMFWALDAALSPAFDDGHPAILLAGADRLYEYRADTGTVRPVLLEAAGVTDNWVVGARYSASYPADPTILVSARTLGYESMYKRPTVHRCQVVEMSSAAVAARAAELDAALRLRCDEQTTFPANPIVDIELQHGRGSAPEQRWAVAGPDVYVSGDDERTFHRTARPRATWSSAGFTWGSSGYAFAVAAVPGTGGRSVVVAQSRLGGLSVLERTDDGGATWAPLHVDIAGFEAAAVAVTVTPTGRILAAGQGGGLACSADGGRTWAPTCAEPDLG